MKVYITHCKNIYGGYDIDEVFDNRDSARIYVMTDIMLKNATSEDNLIEKCDEHIEEHTVIDIR